MQVLIPLAGHSTFFPADEYPFPKPLIEIAGVPMIEWVLTNVKSLCPQASCIFVVREQDITRFSLDATLKLLAGDSAKVVSIKNITKGALCSCLLAIDELDLEQPLVIMNGDQIIDANLGTIVREFVRKSADAGVIVFDSVHPRWSFVRADSNGLVFEAAEKQVLSRNAIAGFYYFKTANQFFQAAMGCIEAGQSHNDSYFIAPCLNQLILSDKKVVSGCVPSEKYHSFYSPAKIAEFEQGLMAKTLKSTDHDRPVQVLIPAAGEGSRFTAAGYTQPKPFIDVAGRPMIDRVLENVRPCDSTVTLLLRRDHVTSQPELAAKLISAGHAIHPIESLTEGTACTILLARGQLDRRRPLLIANCDQLVDFNVDDFIRDCITRDLDGSILVFKDQTMDPKWSFARVDTTGFVQDVAEKKPISNLATVGIYLFRRAGDFIDSAIDMIARNDRINNEFYTCPVYNYMIAMGKRIGVFEVQASAMHGLGTPGDLESYLKRMAHG